MLPYEEQIKIELRLWEKEILADTGLLEGLSRKLQKKVDSIIPEKIHLTLTKAMEVAVKSVLQGINLIPVDEEKLHKAQAMNLKEIDAKVTKIIANYKKIGAVSGAGTGAGGVLAMTLDYPALISVKLKMLQEIAQAFGCNIKRDEERVYLLKVFLLAFSGDISRKNVYLAIKNWKQSQADFKGYQELMDWREFYSEYKESIEFKKMLQFIPGVGSLVGAWANYDLVNELGQTAQNAYRLRYLKENGF